MRMGKDLRWDGDFVGTNGSPFKGLRPRLASREGYIGVNQLFDELHPPRWLSASRRRRCANPGQRADSAGSGRRIPQAEERGDELLVVAPAAERGLVHLLPHLPVA